MLKFDTSLNLWSVIVLNAYMQYLFDLNLKESLVVIYDDIGMQANPNGNGGHFE